MSDGSHAVPRPKSRRRNTRPVVSNSLVDVLTVAVTSSESAEFGLAGAVGQEGKVGERVERKVPYERDSLIRLALGHWARGGQARGGGRGEATVNCNGKEVLVCIVWRWCI